MFCFYLPLDFFFFFFWLRPHLYGQHDLLLLLLLVALVFLFLESTLLRELEEKTVSATDILPEKAVFERARTMQEMFKMLFFLF